LEQLSSYRPFTRLKETRYSINIVISMAGGGSLDERENIAWGTRKMQSVIRQY
jgi:hypothetical protein